MSYEIDVADRARRYRAEPVDALALHGKGRTPPDEDTIEERTFRAKFPGHCHACNLPIAVGQLIAWVPGFKPRHAGC